MNKKLFLPDNLSIDIDIDQLKQAQIVTVYDNYLTVFIDASNIYHVGKEFGISVNYSKLRALLKKQSKSF